MTQLITPEYLAMNQSMHEGDESYGVSGYKFAKYVQKFCETVGTRVILDYGCGKRTMAKRMPVGYIVTCYDPCIPGFGRPPMPHRMVACTDVLEHIEPPLIDNVLDDIARLSDPYCFMAISTRKAMKKLPDGRNAHLIIEDHRWWLEKIMKRFDIVTLANIKNRELMVELCKRQVH